MKRKKTCCRASAMVIIAMLSLSALCNNNAQMSEYRAVLSMQDGVKTEVVAPISAFAVSDDALTGTWTIDRVKVKKTVDGVSSENTYSLKQKFETFIPCPKKITFGADGKTVFEYENRVVEGPFEYTVEGNQIKRMVPVAVYTYEYTITDTGELQLVYSIDYARNSTSIVEEYTYFGTKNK